MSLAGDITGDNALKIMIGQVEVSPLALATLVAIILNLVIPETKDEPEVEDYYVNLASSQAVDIKEETEKSDKKDK